MQKKAHKGQKTKYEVCFFYQNLIYQELGKRLKFVFTTKWYIHKPESVKRKQKILTDFKIDIYHLIPARRPTVNILRYKRVS